jgi:hypothetical protein
MRSAQNIVEPSFSKFNQPNQLVGQLYFRDFWKKNGNLRLS